MSDSPDLFTATAERLVNLRLARDGGETKNAIAKGGPIARLLLDLQAKAADALVALVQVNPTDWQQVARCQNEVARFVDAVVFIQGEIADGDEAYERLDRDEQDQVESLVFGPSTTKGYET